MSSDAIAKGSAVCLVCKTPFSSDGAQSVCEDCASGFFATRLSSPSPTLASAVTVCPRCRLAPNLKRPQGLCDACASYFGIDTAASQLSPPPVSTEGQLGRCVDALFVPGEPAGPPAFDPRPRMFEGGRLAHSYKHASFDNLEYWRLKRDIVERLAVHQIHYKSPIYPVPRQLDRRVWPPAPSDEQSLSSFLKATKMDEGVFAFWLVLYPFVVCPRFCVNHYILMEHSAVGHWYNECDLVGGNNVCHAYVKWGDQNKTFAQVKKLPRFDLHGRKSVCYTCWVPALLHGPLTKCHLPDVIPHLLFMAWVHHREKMVSDDNLPEITEDTCFSEYWSLLKVTESNDQPILLRYMMWIVWGIGFASLGFE